MTEHWRRVVGYEKFYAVSTLGRVFSSRKMRILQTWVHKKKHPCDQYLVLELTAGGVSKPVRVHKIVLTAFRGPRLEGQESRHLDGDCTNNRLSNLVWGTYQENRADRLKHGKSHKLTVEQVNYIRTAPKTLRALAAEVGTCKSNVALVRNFKTWKDV